MSYFPLKVGDVVIRQCNGNCEKVPTGWTHLGGDDDSIFRMVVEAQPGSSRAQRRAASKHKHQWQMKTNGKTVCECGAEKR